MAGVASTMDSELYKTVITIVDERIKEIKVTRKDFDDLKSVVGELAEAQKRTEITLQGLTKEVGALSRNFGFGLEDIGHVVLPGYLKRHYKIDMGEFERKFFEVNGKLVEINLFAEGRIKKEKITILGEVKSRI